MRVCDDGHEEIAYEGNWKTDCPVCVILKEKSELETTVEELKEKIKEFELDLERKNDNLE